MPLKMSLNFALANTFTNISCSSICADGYDVTNLICEDATRPSKGYQGERFVRTPVTIQVQLYVPIHVHRIDVKPWIGRQSVKVMRLQFSSMFPLAEKSEKSITNIIGNVDSFKTVASVQLDSPKVISFENRGYRPHPKLELPPQPDDNSKIAYLCGHLSNVTAVRIVLCQMLLGSVPSVSKLLIWGRPAKSCNTERYKEVMSISNVSRGFQDRPCSSATSEVCDSKKKIEIRDRPETDIVKESRIPLDYLDPLTFDVMRNPVLLPSGHTIDGRTLEKHISSQEEMGKIASDPFTGILFGESSRPVPNTKLKERLDKYFYQRNKKDCKKTLSIDDPKTENSNNLRELYKRKLRDEHSRPCKKIKSEFHNLPVTEAFYQSNSSSSHEVTLSSSLNASLNKVSMRNVSERYMCLESTALSVLYCSKCNVYLTTAITQYQLPCNHVMCCECLREPSNRQNICPACNAEFESKHVRRVHT